MTIPEHDYGQLQEEVIEVIKSRNLVVLETQVKKIIQFYETLEVRHGVMLVGPTGGGKTTIYEVSFSFLVLRSWMAFEVLVGLGFFLGGGGGGVPMWISGVLL